MSTNNTSDYNRRSALEAAKARAARATQAKRTNHPTRDLPTAFAYLRVSTKEQARTGGGAEGYSIPAQRDACRHKAAQLGAVLEAEYVDAGESAKSADRDDLQRMLQDIKTVRPDYLIVHKVDRLARNRADDIAINLLLKQHGVTLVSCSENIDDTPTGRLLYGLLAELAQFYSGNLGLEVMKGLIRKAEEGGTPFRAPLGYTNRRETRDGVEHSWVELDEFRAEIIKWCVEEYATGEWSGINLTLAAQAKGLTTRPTPKRPSQPISLNGIYHILQNPYYMGVVSYRGVHYQGKHPALVEPDVWLAVQDNLAAHAHRGEKDRVHPHYLRGTIYCSDCGARLVYSENKNRHGTSYLYYFCLKKKLKANTCARPAMRLERIEDGIADFYRRFRLRPEQVEAIRQAVREELASQQQEAKRGLERATTRQQRIQHERQKLLEAHYAGAIPQDVLASEMQRFTRELAQVETEIRAAKATNAEVADTLRAALHAASNAQGVYLNAPGNIRRQINQGFFEKLYIGEDGQVERAEFTEPFKAMLDPEMTGETTASTATEDAVSASQDSPDEANDVTASVDTTDRTRPRAVFLATWGDGSYRATVTDRGEDNTDRLGVQTVGGVKDEYVVGATGFEPVTARL